MNLFNDHLNLSNNIYDNAKILKSVELNKQQELVNRNPTAKYYQTLVLNLQEQVQYLKRQLNEANTPVPTQGTPSIPPSGIDPRMFDPRLISPYELPARNPSLPVPGMPSEKPPTNQQDGSIWHDTGGNTWIWRGNKWRCIESANDLPPKGTSYNPYNGRVYPPGHGGIDGRGVIPDWWDEEFGQQTPGQAFDDLWQQLFGPRPAPSINDNDGNPLRL
jgi:hypothetical protein